MVQPTQILQALNRIIWRDTNMYSSQPALKATVEAAVQKHYDDKKLEKRGVETAVIKFASFSFPPCPPSSKLITTAFWCGS